MLERTRRPLRTVQTVQQSIQRSDSEGSSSTDLDRPKKKSTGRPQTATLARPRVLDTCYLTKVDMSLTRKALLSVNNLCKKQRAPPKAFAKITTSGAAMQLRPKHKLSSGDESWEDEEEPAKSVVLRAKTFVRENGVPKPCRSCGRNDLPERLHSHPAPAAPSTKQRPPLKSSVQRPTPIKYKSVKSKVTCTTSFHSSNLAKKNAVLKQAFFPAPCRPNPQGVLFGPSSAKPAAVPNSKPAALSPKTSPVPPTKPNSPKRSPRRDQKGVSKIPAPKQAVLRAASPRSFVVVEEKQPRIKLQKVGQVKLAKSKKQKPAVLKVLQPAETNVGAKKLNPNLQVPQRTQHPFEQSENLKLDASTLGNKRPLSERRLNRELEPSKIREDTPRLNHLEQETKCYLCGRSFATLSLPLHEPICLRKWRQDNEKLPQEQRKPEPRPPQNHFTDVLEREENFGAMYESHLEQLVPCGGCGRTFLPERLEVHTKSCHQATFCNK
ncbi:ubiquitin carboxyl-terminal hydrolase 31-like [Neocloeon triangulifer]|uniref:ubiquitin carboxyl-terminal hydrolase 31-like n=1 Tax=Neocloeon triangulifer TaxID=2078957 RepID=UPI00286EC5AB|nr:ubiquitin carboxyl-terminal hydrolase 31-like [Neocloeon triangulifer]